MMRQLKPTIPPHPIKDEGVRITCGGVLPSAGIGFVGLSDSRHSNVHRFGAVLGCKPKMSKADVRKAAAMLMDPTITKAEVARHFGVSRMTLNEALKREGYGLNPAARVEAT